MNSFEFNKIAGGVLFAVFVVLGTNALSDLIFTPHELEESAYKVPGLEEGADAAGHGGGEAAPEVSIATLLATADPAAGEGDAKKCAACHSFDQGGPNKVGPNLWGVLGRDIASVAGFSYSSALQDKEGAWTYDNLNAFLKGPKDWAPGTKMAFAGLKKPEDRADAIAYLRTLGSESVPLPEPEAAAPAEMMHGTAPAEPEAASAVVEQAANAVQSAVEAAAGAASEAVSGAAGAVMAMASDADPEKGKNVAKKCVACHSFDEGGPNKVGPHLWGIVGRDVGSVEGFKYSTAMAEFPGEWTTEHLDEYLKSPRDYVKGTKMSFAGVKDDADRAALVAYLKTLGGN